MLESIVVAYSSDLSISDRAPRVEKGENAIYYSWLFFVCVRDDQEVLIIVLDGCDDWQKRYIIQRENYFSLLKLGFTIPSLFGI